MSGATKFFCAHLDQSERKEKQAENQAQNKYRHDGI